MIVFYRNKRLCVVKNDFILYFCGNNTVYDAVVRGRGFSPVARRFLYNARFWAHHGDSSLAAPAVYRSSAGVDHRQFRWRACRASGAVGAFTGRGSGGRGRECVAQFFPASPGSRLPRIFPVIRVSRSLFPEH